MNRTTKAMARLGTLAVVAGSALSAPFAIGAANAVVPITFTVAGPAAGETAGGATTAAIASARTDDAANHITVTPAGFTGALTMSLTGSSAYFANPLPVGYVGSSNNQTVTCAAPCAGNAILVDDNVGEAASLGASDGAGDTGIATLDFNRIQFSGCPAGDLNTAVNCVTQGQVGTPIQVVVHYAAGVTGAAQDNVGRQLQLQITGPAANPASPVFVGAPLGAPQTITCTTDASGNCTVNVLDANAGDTDNVSAPVHNGHDTITATIAQAQTPNYPSATGTQALNITPGSVALARLDLESAQLIGPSAQDPTATFAEPGDAVQLVYQATGSCTPASGFATCTGQQLSDQAVKLSVDHGFFTPNCEQTQSDDPGKLTLNFYGSCSFSTAPAAGGQVGNLTNSGTTKTVTTNTVGQFVVTIGIGRDSAFDQSGAVVAHVTSGSIGATIPATGAFPAPVPPATTVERLTSQTCATQAGASDVVAPTAGAATAKDYSGCPADIEWVTNEQPLNGGTAKFSVVPPLSSPNNVSINTENNYAATDSGTTNVPDVGRVVFKVNMTDQFGNLVQFTKGAATATLTKTGPGAVGQCPTATSTDACGSATGGFFGGGVTAVKSATASFAGQPDGTQKETDTAIQGAYLNLPVGTGAAAPGTGPQVRYQADVLTQDGSAFNNGYATGTPSVNDGTQTDVLSWAAPTTTFKTQTAGIWSYAAGTATAATDTLTLNFYNQLAQPVVTFGVTPSSHVAPGTGVTVSATVIDQHGNPLVGQAVDAIRSGSNESSCQPTQTVANGGAVGNALFTNTSGVAGYTFSCSAAGVSNVTMVVQGPGGIQLAQGHEAITFSGSATHSTVERPRVSLTSFHKHHLTVHVSTSPRLGARHTVNIYRLINGLKHLVGQTHTGPRGNASLTFNGLRSGSTWRIAAKVVNLGSGYVSQFSAASSHRIK